VIQLTFDAESWTDKPVFVPRTKPNISILISFLENSNPESQETLAPIVLRWLLSSEEQARGDHHSLDVLEGEPNLDRLDGYAIYDPRVYRSQALERGREKNSFHRFVFPILGSLFRPIMPKAETA
jgi:hypothetical protein